MVSEDELKLMFPKVGSFVAAVEKVDQAAVDRVYETVEAEFGVDAPRAVAVLCAELVLMERDRLRDARRQVMVADAEATKYAEAFLDQKRRVAELRELLDMKAASSTASAKTRKGAV